MDQPPLTTGTVPAAGRSTISIGREPAHGRGARWVVARAEEELEARYGVLDDSEYGLTAAMFDPPLGVFLIAHVPARSDAAAPSDPIGGVGLRVLDRNVERAAAGLVHETDGTGEVKRLWVDPTWRGNGIARALMDALEDAARGLGLHDLCLATGDRQPEAVALYRATGWERRDEDADGNALPPGYLRFTKRLD